MRIDLKKEEVEALIRHLDKVTGGQGYEQNAARAYNKILFVLSRGR